jgi:hypothetical protein
MKEYGREYMHEGLNTEMERKQMKNSFTGNYCIPWRKK